jgi:hypothetical protein
MEFKRTGTIDPLVAVFPLVNPDTDEYVTTDILSTSDVKCSYWNSSAWADADLTSGKLTVGRINAVNTSGHKITIAKSAFTSLNVDYPIYISIIDATTTKAYLDTSVEFYVGKEDVNILTIEGATIDDLFLHSNVPPIVTIPATSNKVVPFTFSLTSILGALTDPDSNELAIQTRFVNSGSNSIALYDDEAMTTPATSSSTFSPNYYKAVKQSTGLYKLYLKVVSTDIVNSVVLTIQYKTATLTRQYYAQFSLIMAGSDSVSIIDNSTNRGIIAKALKIEDVSSSSPVTGSVYDDLKDIIDNMYAQFPGTMIASQDDVVNIQNNTNFTVGIPTQIVIPNTGESLIVPITIQLTDGNGNPEDPDDGEIAIKGRYTNLGAYISTFYDDEEHTENSTESTTFTPYFYSTVHVDVGIFIIYWLAPYQVQQDNILFTFRYYEGTVLKEFTRVINQVPNEVGSATLADNSTNKTIIAGSLKETNIGAIEAVSGSFFLDLFAKIDLIIEKLPDDIISDLSLDTIIDSGLTLQNCMELTAAMVDGRILKDSPNVGDLTFYRRNNSTILTITRTTTIDRSRINP